MLFAVGYEQRARLDILIFSGHESQDVKPDTFPHCFSHLHYGDHEPLYRIPRPLLHKIRAYSATSFNEVAVIRTVFENASRITRMVDGFHYRSCFS